MKYKKVYIKPAYLFQLTPWIFDPKTNTINFSWSTWLWIKWRILTGKKIKSNTLKELK